MKTKFLAASLFLLVVINAYSLNIETWFSFKMGEDMSVLFDQNHFSGLSRSYDLYFKIFKKYVFDIEISQLNNNSSVDSLFYGKYLDSSDNEYIRPFKENIMSFIFGTSYNLKVFRNFYILPGLKIGIYRIYSQVDTNFSGCFGYYKKENGQYVSYMNPEATSIYPVLKLNINTGYKVPKTNMRVGLEISYIRSLDKQYVSSYFNVLMFLGVNLL
ncbi:hypothetical protein J7L48_10650 [bacterium]|nr:hypothetical protein [bacterium]